MAKLNHLTSARIELCITFAEKATAEGQHATKQFQSWLLDQPSETQCELLALMLFGRDGIDCGNPDGSFADYLGDAEKNRQHVSYFTDKASRLPEYLRNGLRMLEHENQK